eukprot:TRINITY_DN33973_c0_g1_i1.p1 TRINITY_DN33973_c0_g1~~TRINITY_DN33973_c0_g1_i1.p1  ORF type:complete len:330 (-),score=19.64 TRINITY_DN33973_c0_g1_i1:402-1391(-)
MLKMYKVVVSILLLLFFVEGPASGLSNLRVSVPSIVLRGDTTSFNCSWDMEPVDKVWAVKWYRGNFEIFRFIADEQPPTKIFKLDNFDVDGLLSDGKTLWLRNVNFHNSGQYSCEVVADKTFLTLIKAAHMQVVDLPDEKPRITGIKEKYQIGETMEALCTSWQSHPPANLTWFINEEKAREDYLRPQKVREEYDDTFTSVLGLRFEISRHHFKHGAIKLKCSSSLLTIYWQSSMVELQEASPRLGRVMGVGQEPGSDTIEDMDSVNNPISVSNGIKSDKKGESKSKDENTGIELAGEPWPVASNSNVIYYNLISKALLICYLLRFICC